jgi:hypothetical protein
VMAILGMLASSAIGGVPIITWGVAVVVRVSALVPTLTIEPYTTTKSASYMGTVLYLPCIVFVA